ncbi:ankyrin, partial [Patellaria atrata CBS 101060]
KLLLEHGADPNYRSQQGHSIMQTAVECMKEDLVRLLLEKSSAIVNQRGRQSTTPLMSACKLSLNNISRILLEAGADPSLKDDSGNNALHWCAISGNCNIAEELLKLHPELVNNTSNQNRTALSYAAEHRHSSMLKLL